MWAFMDRYQVHGVLPCIAPAEVLRGKNYNTASEVYSFGIVMNTLATGKGPWHDRAHDISLAKDIQFVVEKDLKFRTMHQNFTQKCRINAAMLERKTPNGSSLFKR